MAVRLRIADFTSSKKPLYHNKKCDECQNILQITRFSIQKNNPVEQPPENETYPTSWTLCPKTYPD